MSQSSYLTTAINLAARKGGGIAPEKVLDAQSILQGGAGHRRGLRRVCRATVFGGHPLRCYHSMFQDCRFSQPEYNGPAVSEHSTV